MKEFIIYEKLMGSAFSLGIVCEDEKKANECLEIGVNEIKRIETLLTEYKPESVTSKINQQPSGKPLQIDREVFQIVKRSNNISALTQGNFDITASAFKRIYAFKNEDFVFPSKEIINQTLSNVGFDKLLLDEANSTITKLKPEMAISFNAIGKGYAADMVKKLWQKMDIHSGFVNASGDLCAFGTKADGSPWQIGIAHPDYKNKPMLFIPVHNQAVATSGDYEQYFMFQGKRYSHNINPKTGLPLHSLKSVSIISPSAELSDALATAVYVMGERKGIEFVNQLPQTFAIIIDQNNQVSMSKQLNYETNHL